MADAMKRLKAILAEVTDIQRAGAVLDWDQETYMPPGGIQNRADQASTLSEVAHRRFTSDEVGLLIEEAETAVSNEPFDSDDASIVRVTRRDYELDRKLPPELVAEIAHAGSAARPHWQRARKEAKFEIFAPYLQRAMELNQRMAEALGYEKRPYDALLNRTEPGLTTHQLEAIFEELRTAIVPLVAGIARHADTVDDSVLHRGFDPDKQVQYALGTVVKLGYDLERGRQDISTHPFSIAFGPGDVRITTRVNRDFFNECLFGSIHEAGHGMYFQGIGRNIDRTPLWDGASPGVHESQSRLWENLVGRSLPFWHHFFPSLRETFSEPLRGVEAEAFYRAVNKSYPSFIRVEADEVTYNLHVLLRFELENDMLEGKLKVNDVPEAWNELFKSYFGLDVPNDREGALQDIHWSFIGFAEFPGYTLGNIISAQFMEKIRAEMPDLDSQIGRGEFGPLLRWLQENVYQHGRKFTPNELVERVTGHPISPKPWIAYVRKKFGALYGLESVKA
ncbi:MAG: carboxypeptidase M32 [Chloroflexi bacterium]|nr:MAG: carboxypeptidase M32 [Chloroflexota bacterium]